MYRSNFMEWRIIFYPIYTDFFRTLYDHSNRFWKNTSTRTRNLAGVLYMFSGTLKRRTILYLNPWTANEIAVRITNNSVIPSHGFTTSKATCVFEIILSLDVLRIHVYQACRCLYWGVASFYALKKESISTRASLHECLKSKPIKYQPQRMHALVELQAYIYSYSHS